MDSLTQLTLGMAVAQVVLPKVSMRYTLPFGAALGTLPDLDVLISFGDPVSNFVYHRSFSHSIFVLTLVTPCFSWLWYQFLKKKQQLQSTSFQRVVLATWLVFMTHVIIDACTIYGTQLLWPLDRHPESWGTIFIIDPLYTLPLLIGLIMTARKGEQRFNRLGLLLSSLYLVWTGVSKVIINKTLENHWQQNAIEYQTSFSVPTPLNTLLWRGIAYNKKDSVYYETYVSLPALLIDYFSGESRIKTQIWQNDQEAVAKFLGKKHHLEHLEWFTHGFVRYRQVDGHLLVADLRMGAEPNYVFEFKLGPLDTEGDFHPERIPFSRDSKLMNPFGKKMLSH